MGSGYSGALFFCVRSSIISNTDPRINLTAPVLCRSQRVGSYDRMASPSLPLASLPLRQRQRRFRIQRAVGEAVPQKSQVRGGGDHRGVVGGKSTARKVELPAAIRSTFQ
jgi:hypothetical protein